MAKAMAHPTAWASPSGSARIEETANTIAQRRSGT